MHGAAAGALTREHPHAFVRRAGSYAEKIVTRQCVQARLADSAIYLHAWACVLSKLDRQIGAGAARAEAGRAAADYFMDYAVRQVTEAGRCCSIMMMGRCWQRRTRR